MPIKTSADAVVKALKYSVRNARVISGIYEGKHYLSDGSFIAFLSESYWKDALLGIKLEPRTGIYQMGQWSEATPDVARILPDLSQAVEISKTPFLYADGKGKPFQIFRTPSNLIAFDMVYESLWDYWMPNLFVNDAMVYAYSGEITMMLLSMRVMDGGIVAIARREFGDLVCGR